MREIQLRDAKAGLSAVIDDAMRGEPALITRHGKPQPVVLGFQRWERLSQVPSFGRLLMAAPITPDDPPERDQTPSRAALFQPRLYLVDTNIISAGAPSRLTPPGLAQWMDAQSNVLWLSAVTFWTARRHGLTILSGNVRHFAPLGVAVVDPFGALPPAETVEP